MHPYAAITAGHDSTSSRAMHEHIKLCASPGQCLVPESSWCRLLRLLKLLQQLFVMSLTAPQRQVPLINKALPVWLSYLGQLAYIVGLFLNFLACLW